MPCKLLGSKARNLFFFRLLCITLWGIISGACRTIPPEPETPLPIEAPVIIAPEPERPANTGGIVEEIRSLIELGVPSSLMQAMNLIRDRDAGSTEFGRVMNAVIGIFFKTLYPAVRAPV